MEVYINVKNKLDSSELANYLEETRVFRVKVCIPNSESNNYSKDYYIQNYQIGSKLNNEGYLLNHSDYKESTEIVKEKIGYLNKNDKKILLCIGEAEKACVVIDYLRKQVSELTGENEDYKNVTFVYEPQWAIAKRDMNFNLIKENLNIFNKIIKEEKKFQSKILYGGGLTLEMIDELLESNLVDGILVCTLGLDLKKLENLSTKYDFV